MLFFNTDETHHRFSTARNKGGLPTISYANVSFPWLDEHVVKRLRHTTGCYTTNLAGEVLPLLYIFDSKAKKDVNFTVDSWMCIGLPKVLGVYGLYKPTCYASYFDVYWKGSMDTSI